MMASLRDDSKSTIGPPFHKFIEARVNQERPDCTHDSLWYICLSKEHLDLQSIACWALHFNGLDVLCRSDDTATADDNAAAALGKVLEFQAGTIDTAPLVPTWLGTLPIRHDLTEAHSTHAQLVRFLEASDPRWPCPCVLFPLPLTKP